MAKKAKYGSKYRHPQEGTVKTDDFFADLEAHTKRIRDEREGPAREFLREGPWWFSGGIGQIIKVKI